MEFSIQKIDLSEMDMGGSLGKSRANLVQPSRLMILPHDKCIVVCREVFFPISQQEIVQHHSQKTQGRNLWAVI